LLFFFGGLCGPLAGFRAELLSTVQQLAPHPASEGGLAHRLPCNLLY